MSFSSSSRELPGFNPLIPHIAAESAENTEKNEKLTTLLVPLPELRGKQGRQTHTDSHGHFALLRTWHGKNKGQTIYPHILL
ncbi:MAG: hypothetical protein J7K15_11810 [Deltaproteobacteria bacterium]|nr:hypothetical protein [Deltaproteobacteria bacterium]